MGITAPPVSAAAIKANGATTARLLSARFADDVNVKDFGAVGNGSTDDAAAINAAFAYVRATRGATQSKIVFPPGAYLVQSTINATGLKTKSVVIEGGGANIIGMIAGKPVIDALSTQYLRIRDLTITGHNTTIPSVGLRIGRAGITTTESCDNVHLDTVAIQGSFTLAGLHNLNAETSTFTRLVVVNAYNSATSYGVVMDGLNHFNAQSDFIAVTAPVDTPQSFNENVFINADIRHNSIGVPVWMGQTSRHRWIGCYIAAVSGVNGVVLHSVSSLDNNEFLDFDTHIETPSIVNAFLLTGPNTSPKLTGLKYSDQICNAQHSVFKLDTGVTFVTAHGCELQIGQLLNGAVVFDDPIRWNMTGFVYAGGSVNFNVSSTGFNGLLNAAGTFRFITNGSNRFTGTTQLSFAAGITAAGTTQATATALAKDINDVTTVASGTGVVLTNLQGQRQEVFNSGANTLNVYPSSGVSIGSNGANIPVTLAAGAHATFVLVSSTLCRQTV